jgi:cytochrome P450
VPTVLPGQQNPYLLLSMDPPAHTRVRRLVARAFTRRAVERMEPRVQEIADELVDAMVAHGAPVDFVDAFAAPLPATVISEFIGAPGEDQRRLREWMDILLSVTAHTRDEMRTAGEQMSAYLGDLIAAKRADPTDDLLSELIRTHDEDGDRLSGPELLYTAHILLVGGYETTAGLLANSVLTLHRHPEALVLLRERPELIPTAVEEILRYVPISAGSLDRVATEDVELSGVRVPAGTVLVPLQYSANRDEALTPDPDRFDITRPPGPHMTFGHGIHYCLGAQLARLELRTAYGTLVRRLPTLRPTNAVTWKRGMITRGPAALPVVW